MRGYYICLADMAFKDHQISFGQIVGGNGAFIADAPWVQETLDEVPEYKQFLVDPKAKAVYRLELLSQKTYTKKQIERLWVIDGDYGCEDEISLLRVNTQETRRLSVDALVKEVGLQSRYDLDGQTFALIFRYEKDRWSLVECDE